MAVQKYVKGDVVDLVGYEFDSGEPMWGTVDSSGWNGKGWSYNVETDEGSQTVMEDEVLFRYHDDQYGNAEGDEEDAETCFG